MQPQVVRRVPEQDVNRPPDVSVIVVSWRTRDLTMACLESVVSASNADGVSTEIIVVDNASDDGTVEAIAATMPQVVVIESDTNIGFSAACNRGAVRATGRYLLMLNSDATLRSGVLRALVEFLDATPAAAVAGCQLVSPDGSPQFSCGRFLTPLNQFAEVCGLSRIVPWRALRRSYCPDELAGPHPEVDWVVGASLAIDRNAFREAGGFDERFFMYSEDEDLCRMLRESGRSVHLLTGTQVRHVGGGSASLALARMRGELRRSQTALIRKHDGVFMSAVFWVLMGIASLKPGGASTDVGWGR